MAELKYEIVQHLATIAEGSKGWSKELNLVSWNERDPKFDLREWSPDHTKMGKGITLTYDDSVPVYLAKIAYGSKKNARGLRDAVRRQVEDQLASALVFHQDQDIQAIALTAGDDGVQLQINP